MPRILSIDYGKKRTGIAVTDELELIASGLGTIPSKNLIWFLKDYFKKESVTEIVLGYPTGLNGQPTDITAKVEKIHNQLQKIFPNKKVILLDERFTSKMAASAILQSGVNRKTRQNKGLVDKVSATIILQDYLEQKPSP